MSRSITFITLITWFLFMPIAILNGIIRNAVYKPYVGDLAAHQISTSIAILAFLVLGYYMLRQQVQRLSTRTLFTIGLTWVLLTILFEFGAGHYIFGNPWERLLADYNLFEGRVWSLFLASELASPLLIKWLVSRAS